MVFVDTNYLIRFFTGDIKKLARQAKRVLEKEKIYVAEIVLAETVFILETHYKSDKNSLCDTLSFFLNQPNIYSASFIHSALEIYRNENISFYDSLLISQVLEEKEELKTFDKKLSKVFSKYLQN